MLNTAKGRLFAAKAVQINNNEMLARGIGLRDSLQVRLKCKS